MASQIKCECGYVARAETDDEVIDLIERHVRSDHPELAETETREEIAGLDRGRGLARAAALRSARFQPFSNVAAARVKGAASTIAAKRG